LQREFQSVNPRTAHPTRTASKSGSTLL
jgi:hypothetical protein